MMFWFDFFQGADIVVALTHMRWPNDRKVAREVDVDIVLGGHDHDYIVEQVQRFSTFLYWVGGGGGLADIVVALIHMRWPNDRKVAGEVDVDIVLGGHDQVQ